MVRIKIFFLFLLLYSSIAYSSELNEEEEMYFNFVDLNNDGVISYGEIEQSLNLLFQIIDLNQDNKISQNEINELKGIIETLR
jgi:Ca2+-binding EF-hand superfamily protein